MRVLGISAYSRDSAVALVEDGRVVAAAQEERFSRRKFEPGFPAAALRYCLDAGGCTLAAVDRVVFAAGREPVALRRALRSADAAFDPGRLGCLDRHFAHAAAGFYPSPFEAAAVLTIDGGGGTSIGFGEGAHLASVRTLDPSASLARLYSAFADYLGFRIGSGEYKMMGLAPYGDPGYAGPIRDRFVEVAADGGFRLAAGAFDDGGRGPTLHAALTALFGRPPRHPDAEPPSGFHADVAASIQAVAEEIVLGLARAARCETGADALCLSGEVALNCAANGRVLREAGFGAVWVPPAPGDAGAALGAALAGFHLDLRGVRDSSCGDALNGGGLGPEFGDDEIARRLTACGARFAVLPEADLIAATADALAAGRCVGWMQGRMEFGPRALGARSILCDPRLSDARLRLNRDVKLRERFRPFAPSVLREDADAWFALDADAPYMSFVAPVRAATLPAVTHVDGSARVQTVGAGAPPRFRALLRRFKDLTGCGVLVNTSFNVRGEPIVRTPEDAFRCFMGTGIEVLAAGSCLLDKAAQTAAPDPGYGARFARD